MGKSYSVEDSKILKFENKEEYFSGAFSKFFLIIYTPFTGLVNLNLESSNENRFFFYMIVAVLGLFLARKIFKFNCVHKKCLKSQLRRSFNIQSLANKPYQVQLPNGLKPDFGLTTRMGAIV